VKEDGSDGVGMMGKVLREEFAIKLGVVSDVGRECQRSLI
jgi:hypothetical protein